MLTNPIKALLVEAGYAPIYSHAKCLIHYNVTRICFGHAYVKKTHQAYLKLSQAN